MKNKRSRPVTIGQLSVVVLLIAGIAFAAIPSLAAPDLSPQATVERAWDLARQSGRYHFTTRIEQITHPAPSLANVGRGSRISRVRISARPGFGTRLEVLFWVR